MGSMGWVVCAAVVVGAVLVGAGCRDGKGEGGGGGERVGFLALGDSYTVGEGVSVSERWPERVVELVRKGGVDLGGVKVVARTGWTTGELMEGIAASGVRGPYRVVTVMIGVNDQYRGRPVEGFRGGFKEVLSRAVELAGGNAGHVVVVSIPDWGVTPFAEGRDREGIAKEIDAFNGVAREEALRAGARWVDVTTEYRKRGGEAGMVAGDGLHPSGAMQGEWAGEVAPVVLEVVK